MPLSGACILHCTNDVDGAPFGGERNQVLSRAEFNSTGRKDMRSIALGVSIGLVCCAIAVLATPQPAQANCYELIGCTNKDYFKQSDLKQLGCQPLWEVRNWIYKQNGYCFHTQEGDQCLR
jgi:hypothetical protein